MRTSLFSFLLFVVMNVFASGSFASAQIHHQAKIAILPAIKTLMVEDHVAFAAPPPRIAFRLHKDLSVTLQGEKAELRPANEPASTPYKEYEIVFKEKGPAQVILSYSGVIFDPVIDNQSEGLISDDGAVLFGSSYWLPTFEELASYDFSEVQLPSGWRLASPQQQSSPQQDIYLVAGPFIETKSQHNVSGVPIRLFFRRADPALAEKYLTLLPEFIRYYSQTFGAYPYSEFAVIENFWETGFGMPGFTLLGPQVMRLPQILNSSLPHEVLHNWWGNGVYVDYQQGNWSEGLTSYLADHQQQEKLPGADKMYRLQTLMNFQDYTRNGGDFPLRKFTSRDDFSSQAVGYGKAMMFFHGIREKLGTLKFHQALADFFRQHLFQRASYEDLRTAFQKQTDHNLQPYFTQMLDHTGAPVLSLVSAERTGKEKNFVTVRLKQTGSVIYDLKVPVRFTFSDGTQSMRSWNFSTSEQLREFKFEKTVKSVEVDPNFDVFRWLHADERPLSMSALFGAKKIAVISAATEQQAEAFANLWKPSLQKESLFVVNERDLEALPAETDAVVLLGESKKLLALMEKQLKTYEFQQDAESLTLFGTRYLKSTSSTAIMARDRQTRRMYLWIRSPDDILKLAPRLLHYGRYGVLVLTSTGASLKSTWPVDSSPLNISWP